MLRSLSVFVIAVVLPVTSQYPPTWVGGSTVVLAGAFAQPASTQTITVVDPVGDTLHNAPAFQDIVSAQMTKTATGDFELLMEMAGPVPTAPPLAPPGNNEIWWFFGFDLDPTTFPKGYPLSPGSAIPPEFVVCVSWNGTDFAATAIDRRPLITGGEAIITTVPFSINGSRVEAVVPSTLIGDVPAIFGWRLRTTDWSGPVGSGGLHNVDGADFNP